MTLEIDGALPPDEGYYRGRVLPFDESAKGRAELALALERLERCGARGPLLDLGCGPGEVARALRARGLRVVAADVSPAALRVARERLAGGLVAADGERLGFADASFGGVLLLHVLGHVADPARALAEVRRVLRPGGALVAVTPNAAFVEACRPLNESGRLPYRRDPTVRRYLDRDDLARLLADAGLADGRVEEVGAPAERAREVAGGPLPLERLLALARRPSG